MERPANSVCPIEWRQGAGIRDEEMRVAVQTGRLPTGSHPDVVSRDLDERVDVPCAERRESAAIGQQRLAQGPGVLPLRNTPNIAT